MTPNDENWITEWIFRKKGAFSGDRLGGPTPVFNNLCLVMSTPTGYYALNPD